MNEKTVNILVDTDIGPDCDDAGALAILHCLAERGAARILGIMHCTSSIYGAGCIDAINRYFGRTDIPVGTLKKEGFLSGKGYETYNRYITENYHNEYKDCPAQDAVSLYRKIMMLQPDNSIILTSIGPLPNLAMLLDSQPDEFSSMTGYELIRSKVVKLVSMAGQFEKDANGNLPAEWNVLMDISAAQKICHHWPTPIVFCGWETGANVITGKRLVSDCEANNPIKDAYELFTKGKGRSSWDLIAVLYAILGECELWNLSSNGIVKIDNEGVSHFSESSTGTHRYLINSAANEDIEQFIDGWLLKPACIRPVSKPDLNPVSDRFQ